MDDQDLGVSAAERVASRRLATLVARGVSLEEVFGAVVEEVGPVLSGGYADLGRYEPDHTITSVAAWGRGPASSHVVGRCRLQGRNIATLVFETGRPVRIDGDASGVGCPVIVDGRLWGVMSIYATLGQSLPAHAEARLASFTELVAAAITNAESRAELARLADEQAALRRVATLVAGGGLTDEVFEAVLDELGRLLRLDMASICRYEGDTAAVWVANWGLAREHFPIGSRWALGGDNVGTRVFETGGSARIDNYAEHASGSIGAAVRETRINSSLAAPIVVDGRLWGLIAAGSIQDQPLPTDTEARLASFTELMATAIANTESRSELATLADEQAALRRVATLVAQALPPQQVFAAVAEEVGQLFSVDLATMSRYEPNFSLTVVASWGRVGEGFSVGSREALGGHNLGTLVFETGRPARIDNYAEHASGPQGILSLKTGVRSAVGAPILVEGRLWGMISAASSVEQPLPANTEARLASFTELVAMAIANTESRSELAQLAEEQASLRRVATLVARRSPPQEVFGTVIDEVGRVLGVEMANLCRYEPDGSLSVVATWGTADGCFAVGTRRPLGGRDLGTLIFETGGPVRIDDYDDRSGPLSVTAPDRYLRSTVGVPITVEGRLWGVMGAGTAMEKPLPADTESRLASFTELVATAIADAQSRADLMASRARIAAAADETRRRLERDLHDGTQQQLVSVMLELRTAASTPPSEPRQMQAHLARMGQGLDAVLEELREISRGIHPAILSKAGLGAALRALARRSALPVELDLRAERRLPEHVEVAAYYVVSEALTNAAKHAQASVVHITLDADGAILKLAIRDDGIGGADPSQGSGLVGLTDRIEALGGTLQLTSSARSGTSLLIEIPVEQQSMAVSSESEAARLET